jgi:hypothetical protein
MTPPAPPRSPPPAPSAPLAAGHRPSGTPARHRPKSRPRRPDRSRRRRQLQRLRLQQAAQGWTAGAAGCPESPQPARLQLPRPPRTLLAARPLRPPPRSRTAAAAAEMGPCNARSAGLPVSECRPPRTSPRHGCPAAKPCSCAPAAPPPHPTHLQREAQEAVRERRQDHVARHGAPQAAQQRGRGGQGHTSAVTGGSGSGRGGRRCGLQPLCRQRVLQLACEHQAAARASCSSDGGACAALRLLQRPYRLCSPACPVTPSARAARPSPHPQCPGTAARSIRTCSSAAAAPPRPARPGSVRGPAQLKGHRRLSADSGTSGAGTHAGCARASAVHRMACLPVTPFLTPTCAVPMSASSWLSHAAHAR